MPYTVYALVDPDMPEDFRYVGITRNPKTRLNKHITASRKNYPNGTRKENWIGKILSEGREPIMVELLTDLEESEAYNQEIRLIAEFSSQGYSLTNGTSGGPGFDPAWILKTGKTLEELWKDPEWIEGKVQTFKEYWSKPENREKQSKRVSEEMRNPARRQAISESLIKYYEENPQGKWSEEQKRSFKSSDGFRSMVEKTRSPENREKMRKKAAKQFEDPAARKLSSEHAKRGWDSLTPEQREKRVLKGRLGSNLSWARKHGRVLEIRPKNCTCTTTDRKK